jgi:CHASE3 domain sensor protein
MKKHYRLFSVITLLLQIAVVITLYRVIKVSDDGAYEFPFMASRTNVLLLLGSIAFVSLLLGIMSTWLILRLHKSHTKWLWVLLCGFPALFVGALCLHFVLMLNAWV